MEQFDVTAWETTSKGGLLLGLEPAEITKFLQVYRLVYQANDLSAQLVDLVMGIRSALQSAGQSKELYLGKLRATLAEIQTAFSELGAAPAAPVSVAPETGDRHIIGAPTWATATSRL